MYDVKGASPPAVRNLKSYVLDGIKHFYIIKHIFSKVKIEIAHH
jgi:hypothetical protein